MTSSGTINNFVEIARPLQPAPNICESDSSGGSLALSLIISDWLSVTFGYLTGALGARAAIAIWAAATLVSVLQRANNGRALLSLHHHGRASAKAAISSSEKGTTIQGEAPGRRAPRTTLGRGTVRIAVAFACPPISRSRGPRSRDG